MEAGTPRVCSLIPGFTAGARDSGFEPDALTLYQGMSTQVPAGWYPDPANPLQERLWDGSDWVDRIRPLPPQLPGPATDTPATQVSATLPSWRKSEETAPVTTYRAADTGSGSGKHTTHMHYRRNVLVVCLVLMGISAALLAALEAFAWSGRESSLASRLIGFQAVDIAALAVSVVHVGAFLVFLTSAARNAKVARREFAFVPPAALPLVLFIASFVTYGAVLTVNNLPGYPSGGVGLFLLTQLVSTSMVNVPAAVLALLQTGTLLGRERKYTLISGIGYILWCNVIVVLTPLLGFPGLWVSLKKGLLYALYALVAMLYFSGLSLFRSTARVNWLESKLAAAEKQSEREQARAKAIAEAAAVRAQDEHSRYTSLAFASSIAFFIPFLSGLLALYFGYKALRDIRENPLKERDRKKVKVSLVLGWIQTAGWLVSLPLSTYWSG